MKTPLHTELSKAVKAREPFEYGAYKGKVDRRICDACGNASQHFVVSNGDKPMYKRCNFCYAEFLNHGVSANLVEALMAE